MRQIRPALHPSLTVAFTAQAEREATLVKEVQLSTQVTITTATVTHRTAQEVTVRLEARRTIWIGGQQVRDEPVHAELTVVPWLAAGQPAGLVVVAGHDDPHTQCLRLVAGGSPSRTRRRGVVCAPTLCPSCWCLSVPAPAGPGGTVGRRPIAPSP